MMPSLEGLGSKGLFRTFRVHLCLLASLALAGSAAFGQPGFSKSFSPDTIGPGSTSTLEFLIENIPLIQDGLSGPVGDLAFQDNLPAGMVIADFANTTSTCDGIVVAPEGGSTITFSGGMVAENSTCSITVDVEGDFTGFAGEGIVNEVLTNLTGDLTSDAGNSGTAMADLTIDPTLLGFRKAFSPSSIPLGGRSTLTFTIDNSANTTFEFGLTFTDNLPVGMIVAGPANASNDCGGMLTAATGASVISLTGGDLLPAGATCTISVDVVATGAGKLGNASGELTSTDNGFDFLSAGKANDILDVPVDILNLIKSFSDDPVPPETTVTLQFTINNFDRENSATGITFTDDLEAVISGLVAVGLPASDVCGDGSTLTGTSLITLTGGNLPPEGFCTFSVTLQLPVGGGAGVFPNTTSAVSGDVGGSPTTGNAASDLLFVEPGPALTKEFTDDPVGGGDTVNLEFTITNTSPSAAATDIAFSDVLDSVLVGATVPAPGFCGAGATMVFIPAGQFDPAQLIVSGAELAAGASCTFSADLDVLAGAPGGVYPNVTSAITATVDAVTVTGPPASDDLEILGAPSIQKEFTDDPVDPGGTVTLEFTITHDADAPADATDITFTDDLDAALSGLAAVGLPASDVCGVGSTLSGTSTLTFTGGTLAPDETCVFSATLDVPGAAPAGPHTNTTSVVSATVGGTTVMGNTASDDLMISGLDFTKEFIDDPVVPGGSVTLRFTIDNISPVSDATAIAFTDSLGDTLPGLQATGLPANDVCGAGSSISGTSFLSFAGGNLLAGTSCTFDVTLDVPGGADNDSYLNVTSGLLATMEGGILVFDEATDVLEVSDNLLQLEKEFTDDPVAPGDTVTLEFTVTNLDPASAATAITFTDDLDAALAGLVAVGLPAADVCGAGSQISGTSLLTLTGGSLGAGASCTFPVTLQVPVSVELGTVATNVTSEVDGTIDGLAVTGDPATAVLLIDLFSFSKSFDGPTAAGGTVDLTFSITNESAAEVAGVGFSDNLDAVVSGLVAVGLPVSDVCGAGSQIAGTGFLTLTGGTLLPGASCSIVVTLEVPGGAAPGTFTNTTSDLLENGLPAANPAVADLMIEPPPTFSKVFVPDSILQGQVSILTFTIDNTASALTASSLDFTDNMPAAIVIASPANASTTCSGGVITAAPGTSVISYTGGSVGAGASCIVEVDATSITVGAHVNTTGDLTSSSGVSGSASDTLTVEPAPVPGFAKEFAPDSIPQDQISTLTFTIDNTASAVAASSLDFTDNLPPNVVVAPTPNDSTTCTGGTVTAAAGTGVISYTGGSVAAGGSCTVQADVTSSLQGNYVNLTGDLTSSAGNSGSATDELEVTDGIPPQVTNVDSILGTGDGALDECETARTTVTALTITFDEAMFEAAPADPNSVTNPDNWLVVGSGPDQDLSTTVCGPTMGDDVATPIDEVLYDGGSLTATVNFVELLADGPYRLIACSGGLVDANSNPLDGDGNGTGGDDFVRSFRVDRLDAFVHGNFDCTLDDWVSSSPDDIFWSSTEDVDGATISGSAQFTNPAGNNDLSVGQCVEILPESIYELSGFVRLNTAGVMIEMIRSCEFYASSDCSGPALPVEAFFDTISTPLVWESFSNELVVGDTVHSGICQLTLRNVAGVPYSANADDLSMDAIFTMILFRDGFESGDTSAWSTTVP